MGVISIDEFCRKYPDREKVLIAGNVNNGNVLIRKLNRSGENVRFLKVARLVDVAKEIVVKRYALTSPGELTFVKTLPYEGYLMILEKLVNQGINEKKISFIKENSMCMDAVGEIMQQMNQLRLGDKKGTSDELEELIEKYEEQLSGGDADSQNVQIYDDVRFIREALEYLNNEEVGGTPEKSSGTFEKTSGTSEKTGGTSEKNCAVPDKTVYAVLDDVNLTYLEGELVKKLIAVSGADDTVDISGKESNSGELAYIPRISMSAESKDTENVKAHFYSTYGMTTEIRYIINYIEKNKIPFGDVNILYSSRAYDNYLTSELGARRVPFEMLSQYSAMRFYSMNLLMDLLNWVEQDYSYEALYNVFNNKYMKLGYDNSSNDNRDDNEKWTSPFNMLMKGLRDEYKIGWGLERYIEYAKLVHKKIADFENENGVKVEDGNPDIAYNDKGYETDDHENEKKCHRQMLAYLDKKRFADCLEDMAKPFLELEKARQEEKDIAPFELWEALYGVLRRHLRQNREWAVLKAGLDDVGQSMKLKDETSFDGALQELKNTLENVTVSDGERSDAVSVIYLERPMVLDRNYSFFIGLSAADFKVNNTESPVLSDAELLTILDAQKGYIRLGKNAEKERKEYYSKTLKSISKGEVFFGYSYCDVFNMRENSESGWLIDCREKYNVQVENVEKINEMDNLAKKLKLGDNDWLGVEYSKEYLKRIEDLHEELDKKLNEKPADKSDKNPDEETQGEVKKASDTLDDEEETENTYLRKEAHEPFGKNYRLEDGCRVYGPYEFSSTSLQELNECPCKYKYERIDYIPNEEFYSIEPGEWLTAADKGTVIHAVLEDYCNEVMKDKDVGPDLDDKTFNDIFEKRCEEAVKKYPSVSDEIYDRTKKIYRDALEKYLKGLHKELSDENCGWKVFGCEMEFGNGRGNRLAGNNWKVSYDMGGKQASEEYKCELIFNGSIDRVDRRIVSEKDDEGKEIEVEHFRIIDYKSVKQGGGKKLKEKCRYIKHTKAGREDILPHQIQHHIYAMALKSKYPDAVIDEVIYECLLDDETPHLHFPDDMSVGVADAETKKGYYKEMHDNIAELPAAVRDRIAEPLVDGIFSTRNTDKDKVCVYCRYADMCPKMLGEKN